MKCKSCGANLEIDTAFCPYCGKANPVAKKHREDMARYDRDYKKTKAEVIDNSRRFNTKTFFVSVIAVTVAFAALVITLLIFNQRLGYKVYRAKIKEDSINYVSEIQGYIEDRDYLALSSLTRGKSINYYGPEELEVCRYAARTSESYADLFGYLMRLEFNLDSTVSSTASNINYSIKNLFNYAREGRKERPEYNDFYDDIERDTKLMLVEFLGITPEEAEEIASYSDGKLSLFVEEAVNEKTSQE